MNLFVPDASVLLKWVLPGDLEPHREKALSIRESFIQGRIDLLVPSLWIYEVGNILGRHCPEDALLRLEALVGFAIPQTEIGAGCWDQAMKMTITHKVSFYDACYHALAIATEGVFVTADEQYVRKLGVGNHLRTLAQWVNV
ncbi:MAG: type II toxin-antitoxin system VapC family toxin [Leptospirales bacterium]